MAATRRKSLSGGAKQKPSLKTAALASMARLPLRDVSGGVTSVRESAPRGRPPVSFGDTGYGGGGSGKFGTDTRSGEQPPRANQVAPVTEEPTPAGDGVVPVTGARQASDLAVEDLPNTAVEDHVDEAAALSLDRVLDNDAARTRLREFAESIEAEEMLLFWE